MNYNTLIQFIEQGIRDKVITEFQCKDGIIYPKIPKCNGVYIMFEDGQNYVTGNRRIIRIGKAFRKSNDGLKQRIDNNHFNGKISNSVFRKHVAYSILNAYYLGYIDKKYDDIESEVSKFMQEKIKFVLLKINDENLCNNIENALIYLVAQQYAQQDIPTDNWLGKYSLNENITKYKFWNSDSTKKEIYLTKSEEDYVLEVNNYVRV